MVLQIEQLGISYQGKEVLGALNLIFPTTGTIALVGRNGAGKSSLLRVLAGLQIPTSGHVYYSNKSLRNEGSSIGSALFSFHPTQFELSFDLTVNRILKLGCSDPIVNSTLRRFLRLTEYSDRISSIPARSKTERIAEMLQLFDLQQYKDTNFSALSTGYRKLVGLAFCYLKQTPIYLLDEPFANLDRVHQVRVAQEIKKISQHCLVIASVHNIEMIPYYFDHVYLLDKSGFYGPSDQLMSSDFFASVMGFKLCFKKDTSGYWFQYHS